MVHVIISGNVQGVGFRQFVKSYAKKNNVIGWVRNMPDRSVEAMLMGERKSLDFMIEKCRKGPFLAEVKDLRIEDLPDQEFEAFEIIK